MTAIALKKRISKAIERIEDETFLQAIYTIVSTNSSGEYALMDENLHLLDERRKKYLSGKAKTYTVAQARKKAMRNLKK